ncbi:MAG: GNAT family N-acetyltransferase [Lewinella sp.]
MIPRNTILKTSRFQLRIPDETDIDFVFSASRYSGFNDGMQWEPPTEKTSILGSLGRTLQRWDKGEEYAFTVVDGVENSLQLGRVSIRRSEGDWSVGFWVHPEHQRKGVMTEALKAVLAFGFDVLKIDTISAAYATWNKASERVLAKNGFQFVRYLAEGFLKKGEWVPENEVQLTVEQWRQ